eukprot:PhM_4_TR8717/c0_g2_i1/m.2379
MMHTLLPRSERVRDVQIIVSDFFRKTFPLPNKNNAYKMFSTRPPAYRQYLLDPLVKQSKNGAAGVRIKRLLIGSGGKGWAHFLPSYRSPGSPAVWWGFRQHLYNVLEVPNQPHAGGSLNIVIGKKKDKRRIANPDALAKHILRVGKERGWGSDISVKVVDFTELTAVEQLDLFSRSTVYISNEGTSATYFFLMPPGSAFVSIAQFYGPSFRPNKRKRVGGSVDWFPPAIPWVRTEYYENISETETVRDINVVPHNRNTEYSININMDKINVILDRVARHILQKKTVTDVDGYTQTGRVCQKLFTKHTETVLQPMLSRACVFPASFYCEFVVNAAPKERGNHYKYRKGACWKGVVDVEDERD